MLRTTTSILVAGVFAGCVYPDFPHRDSAESSSAEPDSEQSSRGGSGDGKGGAAGRGGALASGGRSAADTERASNPTSLGGAVYGGDTRDYFSWPRSSLGGATAVGASGVSTDAPRGGTSSHNSTAANEGGTSSHNSTAANEGGTSSHNSTAANEGGTSSHNSTAANEGGTSSPNSSSVSGGTSGAGGSGTACGQNLLSNADFEAGKGGGWQEATTSEGPLVSTWPTMVYINAIPAHDGSFYAWLGADNNVSDLLEQSITLPSDFKRGTLSFYYRITSNENTNAPNDKLNVDLVDGSGSTLFLLPKALSNADRATVWRIATGEFSDAPGNSWAGRKVTLRFRSTTDEDAITNFFIDTVALVANPCN